MLLRIAPQGAGHSLTASLLYLSLLFYPTLVTADSVAETGQAYPQGGGIRYVDGITGDDQGGSNDCTSQASPCLTISRAIDASAAFDTIQIADAIYTETLTIDQSLTLNGESEQNTIIQAHPQPFQATDRVVTISGSLSVSMTDLTLRHGDDSPGGGILFNGSIELSLQRITLYRNRSAGDGGGIHADETGCVLTIDESSFIENESQSGDGGGIYAHNCSVEIARTSFIENTSSSGGGVNLLDSVGVVNLARVSFLGNQVRNHGGGLHNFRSTTEILNSVFRGNVAQSASGAGGSGGGLFINSQGSQATLVNVLVSGNVSGASGAGIGTQIAGSTLSLTNTTITGNRAGGAGGGINNIYNGSIRNSIIWNNQDISGTGTASSSVFAMDTDEVDSSLVQGFSMGDLGGSGNLDGTNATNNPQFTFSASPAGAPSQGGDYHPRENSPVVNAGNNAFISGYDVDLDGFDRIVEGIVDLGPYEFGNDLLFRDRFEF